jgi:hypothetical protein
MGGEVNLGKATDWMLFSKIKHFKLKEMALQVILGACC